MSPPEPQSPAGSGNNVASNFTTIYEGGNPLPISIADLLNNEIAIKGLVNNYNDTLVQLKEARGQRLSRSAAIAHAFMGVLGTTIVALATNYVTMQQPQVVWELVFAMGVALILYAAIAPIVIATHTEKGLGVR